jgi:hypothetical protein
VRRATRAFGHFWWDFLVGDTPELFVATVVVVASALLLRHHRQIAIFVLPLMAIVFLVASTLRGRRHGATRGPATTTPTAKGDVPGADLPPGA